ncbi:beta-propeller domain-containing protein, methanol dehydrogenase [Thioflavicoccus mobilis 8321]|uniref:Beta-propeller domain-containing protein, methanol dehydrogenase n=1 Tax=Thioflavicoccus mobilis 8321 TaxID=765912 RepID=L0H1D1_9GAMM|nr:TPM domain-containing protein [Thioflavicoccus mobilis]AGA91445.1 beta-propeller domain-containing protein, methanol dehydrogenase [Thioflavicoccus mobilis 8321]
MTRPGRWLALAIGLSVATVAGVVAMRTASLPEGRTEIVRDDAALLDGAGYARVTEYHDALRDAYDIDYRVVTTTEAPDLNRFAARLFADQRIGSHSVSGRGLLLAINPATDKVRLEVGRSLEGVYTDAFTKYIENEQMVPFFRKERIADGILATTEMIVTRAQEAKAKGAFDDIGRAEPSTGAGAVTEANIGVQSDRDRGHLPDVQAQGASPEKTVAAYIEAMRQQNDRPDLDIYSEAAREMLANWVVTKAQMRNVVRDHEQCRGERARIEGDKAVVRYDAEPKVCNPYFLRLEGGKWRIDFAAMQKLIRFDQHNHWHMSVPNEFSFAFPELAPSVVKNDCRWCFTFRNEDMVVVSIDTGPAAAAMGLKEGDKIIEVAGKEHPGMRWLFNYLYTVAPGEIVNFRVLRDGATLTLSHPAPPK